MPATHHFAGLEPVHRATVRAAALAVVGHIEVAPDQEAERLSAKYGAGKVVKVYGDDSGERLRELVEKAAAAGSLSPVLNIRRH